MTIDSISSAVKFVDWGRRRTASCSTGFKALLMMLVCPMFVLLLSVSVESYHGAVWNALQSLATPNTLRKLFVLPEWHMHVVIAGYMLLQAILYKYLPGSYHSGQLTPAGHLLEYKTNGLLACIVTCTLFALAGVTGMVRASFMASHWSSLLSVLNAWGLLITVAVYVKARLAPTHPRDRVFTGIFSQTVAFGL